MILIFSFLARHRLTDFERLKCDEAPEEPSTVTVEKVLKIECNISATTNYMHTGIKDVCAFFLLGLVFAHAYAGNEFSVG